MSRWDDYAQGLIAAGLAPHEANREAQRDRRDYMELMAGRCPKCGSATVSRTHDGRSTADRTRVEGAWFTFRCQDCKYVCSWVVPNADILGLTGRPS